MMKSSIFVLIIISSSSCAPKSTLFRDNSTCSSRLGKQTECVSIFECYLQVDAISAQGARPQVCDVTNFVPHICCPILRPSVYQCGNPERLIYEQSAYSLPLQEDEPRVGRPVFKPLGDFKAQQNFQHNLEKRNAPVDILATNSDQRRSDTAFSQRGLSSSIEHLNTDVDSAQNTSLFTTNFGESESLEDIIASAVRDITGDAEDESSTTEGPPSEVQFTIGGYDTKLGKWPWMVLFGRWNNSELSDWFCGGTLISPDYVLTAAHCIGSASEISAGVRLGDHDLSCDSEVLHQDRHISRVIVHNGYNKSQNDIALVKLHQPVHLTDAVRPICLPQPSTSHKSGLPVSMAGWGLLQFRGTVTPSVLQEVPLQLADTVQCETTYRQLPSFNVDFPGGFQGTKLCAVSRDDEIRGACTGDSGGPLMWQSSTDGIYELIGVVSTGVGCGHPDYPGVYTRVSAYIDWIRRNAI